LTLEEAAELLVMDPHQPDRRFPTPHPLLLHHSEEGLAEDVAEETLSSEAVVVAAEAWMSVISSAASANDLPRRHGGVGTCREMDVNRREGMKGALNAEKTNVGLSGPSVSAS